MNSVIGRDKSGFPQGVSLDAINDFFQSVAISPQHLSAENYDFSSNESIDDQFMFDKIDSSTVFAHLSSLDVRKSTGPDDLSSRFLKEVASEIAEPLTGLFNYSLQEKVPSAWKRSHITPVHKGGASDDPYRPIAVVPVVAKVLERLSQHSLVSTLREIICCTHIRVLIVQDSLQRIICYWQLIGLLHHWIKEM